MNQVFDQYRDRYEATVESSIAFSGLPHDFFMEAKADLLGELFAERLPDVPAVRLLDVGCGVGRAHPWIRPLVAELSGTDPSAESIARARQDNPSVEYREGDGQTLPFEDGQFDAALAICVMHHVPPAQWQDFVLEMRRVVRPGGLVTIIEHNPWNPGTRLAVARCPFDEDAVLLGARRTETLLGGAELKAMESRHFLLFPAKKPILRRIEKATAKLPLGAQYLTSGIV